MAFNTNYFISSAQKTSSCFLGDSEGKASACNAGDLGSIPGSGRPVEKEIATHSSTLAWRIPWMEEPGKLESMGSQRVRHDWATSLSFQFSRSVMSDSATPWTAACQASLSITNSLSLFKPMSSDVIQPSHPLSSHSPSAFNLSQHRDLFQRVSSSHQVAKVLEFQLQHQSLQWIFRTDFL